MIQICNKPQGFGTDGGNEIYNHDDVSLDGKNCNETLLSKTLVWIVGIPMRLYNP